MNLHKVIAVVGPTASGKSSLAVELAQKYTGEIISADSRQVYRGLNIGSGKITAEEMHGIPHHLLDVADPATPEPFSLSDYLALARTKIQAIHQNNKPVFIVGGTGLYVTALVEGYEVPNVAPNTALRKELEKLGLKELQEYYKALDPEGFNQIDSNNPRRLIRAIEVVTATQQPFFTTTKNTPTFHSLTLGIKIDFEKLKIKIIQRLHERFDTGMLEETIRLHTNGVSWQQLESFGLEYKWMARLAQGHINESETLESLAKEIIAYAKRQLTWWRKRDVLWIETIEEATVAINKFLVS
jgi:tRNA dimethylallyltransferase